MEIQADELELNVNPTQRHEEILGGFDPIPLACLRDHKNLAGERS
jgi:hypothetical protein